MSIRIIVVFAHGDGAPYPFRMDVSESPGHGEIVIPDFEATREFEKARDQAYDVARQLVGGPAYLPGVICVLKRIGAPDHPPLSGDSLYGAIAMAAIQLFANGSGAGWESEMRYQVRSQLNAMRFADLRTVAVSAGVGPAGDFRRVDGMDHKLRSLSRLDPDVLTCCVLALGQDVRLSDGKLVAPPEFFAAEGLRNIPVIQAFDPIDALGQLYERQCRASAEAYERQCKALAGRIA